MALYCSIGFLNIHFLLDTVIEADFITVAKVTQIRKQAKYKYLKQGNQIPLTSPNSPKGDPCDTEREESKSHTYPLFEMNSEKIT